MSHFLDESIGNITDALKATGRWENTLIIFSAGKKTVVTVTYSQIDNGGPAGSGTNYPLRGYLLHTIVVSHGFRYKYSDFDGGTRAAAFVSGPWLPEARRGKSTSELMHICDWWVFDSESV